MCKCARYRIVVLLAVVLVCTAFNSNQISYAGLYMDSAGSGGGDTTGLGGKFDNSDEGYRIQIVSISHGSIKRVSKEWQTK